MAPLPIPKAACSWSNWDISWASKCRDKILLEYYRQWRFKHPNVNDFVQVAEKVSGMKLDWYREYWVYTTKTIDYGIDSLWEEGGMTKIRMRTDWRNAYAY